MSFFSRRTRHTRSHCQHSSVLLSFFLFFFFFFQAEDGIRDLIVTGVQTCVFRSSTLAMLRHVARAGEQTPLLILGTYRETEVDRADPLAQVLAELRRARAVDRDRKSVV